jgi:mRNA interferase MazF
MVAFKTGYIPERGDIVWLDFTPQAGHEQSGRRPAFVLSPAAYNRKTGLAIFCPVTSQIKGYSFEVLIPQMLQVSGAILCDQAKSLDWKSRNAEFACKLPVDTLATVLKRLGTLLQF